MAMKLYSDVSVQSIANSIRDINNALSNKGYTRIEYIQSNGYQYLDLNFKPNQDTKVQLDFQQTVVATGTGWIFGARDSSSLNNYAFLIGTDAKYATPYNKGTGSRTFTFDGEAVDNTIDRHIFIKQRANDGTDSMGTFDDDDVTVYYTSSTQAAYTKYEPFVASYNFFLFNVNFAGEAQTGIRAKIYSCKVWEDGQTLSRDLIPVYRNSDNEIGMYDLVNNVFYSNQGTGDFTGGAEFPKYTISEMGSALEGIYNTISQSVY